MRLDDTIRRLTTEQKFLESYARNWQIRLETYRGYAETEKAKGRKPNKVKRAERHGEDRFNRIRLIERNPAAACEHCGSRENLQIAHITPVFMGGSDDDDNLMVLCRDCHVRYDNMGPRANAKEPRNYFPRDPRIEESPIRLEHTIRRIEGAPPVAKRGPGRPRKGVG